MNQQEFHASVNMLVNKALQDGVPAGMIIASFEISKAQVINIVMNSVVKSQNKILRPPTILPYEGEAPA